MADKERRLAVVLVEILSESANLCCGKQERISLSQAWGSGRNCL